MGRPVMIMAGGTGGHVFPALAVARELRGRGSDVVWIGTRQGLEARVVPEAGFPMEWIRVGGLRGKGWKRWLQAPFKLTLAVIQALRVLTRHRPATVLGMGGFVTGPGGIAARILGIPLVIHEQNAIPGMTNQWLSRIAARVLEGFPGSFPAVRGALCTGNPVRAEIEDLAEPQRRWAERTGPVRLLVVGGSQGAKVLNDIVPRALAGLRSGLAQVRHQAGRGNLAGVSASYGDAGVEAQVTEFIDDMADAYGWADLVVCRAGALTIAELAAAGVGSVLVPYPFAVDDHQTKNARYLVDAGAALLQPQSGLDAQGLAQRLMPLLGDRNRLLDLARAARALARPKATAVVADVCMEMAE